MKTLILGAAGMAGHVITLYFQERGYDVTAYTTKPISFCDKNIVGDALDTDRFKRMITSGNYDVVINCIGILNKAAEENVSLAIYLNSYLPHLVEDLLRGTGTKFIHMSTDCVFLGNTGPYNEDSLCDGRTIYDRSKAMGEVNNEKDITFRNSIIGPDMNERGIGLFNWFMKQNGLVSGYTGALWTGVTTLTLAKAMEQAIKEDLCGLYNLVNNTSISKYDLLCLFNKHCKFIPVTINKNTDLMLDKSLWNNRDDFSFVVPSYEEMVVEMKEWIDAHKEYYPNYYK